MALSPEAVSPSIPAASLRPYKAFYNGKSAEFKALNLWAAKQTAIDIFKAPPSKQGLIAVVLLDVPVDPGSL